METKAPEGYVLDPTPREYTVEASDLSETGELTLMPEEDYLEVPVAFDLEIAKFRGDIEPDSSDHEAPAEGVEFLIISNSTGETVGSIVTGSDGYATTEGLWFGEGERPENAAGALPYDREGYLIRENKDTTPDGLKPLDDWSIEADQMADGVTLRYIVSNQAVAARLQVAKVDADTGERIAAAGFSFQILDEQGEPISQNAWYPNPVTTDVFTTDESGIASARWPRPPPICSATRMCPLPSRRSPMGPSLSWRWQTVKRRAAPAWSRRARTMGKPWRARPSMSWRYRMS